MPYNDTIFWPQRKDVDFPSLSNNETSVVNEDEKFFAEHYNKIRNFIVEGYLRLTDGTTAASDRSLQKISMPYSFSVSLQDVVKYDAYDASTSTQAKIPGNVLPFEFVITFSTDIYEAQTNRTEYDFLLQKANSTELNAGFGTVSPISAKVLVSAQIVGNTDYNFDTTVGFPTHLSTVCSAVVGTDTLLIRGAIIDNRINATAAEQGRGVELWKFVSNKTPILKVSLMAIE